MVIQCHSVEFATPGKFNFSPYEILKGHLPHECIPIEFETDLDHYTDTKLSARNIIDKVWENRNIINLNKTKASSDGRFKIGNNVKWIIKLNNGSKKIIKAIVKNFNETSCLLQVCSTNRLLWVSKNHLQLDKDPCNLLN